MYHSDDDLKRQRLCVMITVMVVKVFNRILEYIVPSTMDELPIEQSRSQPVNPSHVTINGLAHYCTHNASVNNSI